MPLPTTRHPTTTTSRVPTRAAGKRTAARTAAPVIAEGLESRRLFAAAPLALGSSQVDVQVGATNENTSLAFTDADGTATTLSVKGPGTAAVRLTGDDLGQANNRGRLTVAGTNLELALVTLTGTTDATIVTIGGKGGDRVVALGALSTDGPVKSVSGKTVVVTGGLTTAGPIGSLTLGGATGATITLGGTAGDAASTITIGPLTDSDLISGAPVRSLKLASATGIDADPDVISVLGGIDTLNVAGDLAADVNVPGNGNIRAAKVGGTLTGDVTAHQIVSLAVRGDVNGATITATHEANEHADAAEANRKPNQSIGSLKVTRSITTSVIRSAGSIGSISAAGLSGSKVAAVSETASIQTLPASPTDLGQEATINVLKLRSLVNSTVAAKYFGKLSVGTIATENEGTQLGFAADRITSLSGTLAGGGGGRLALKNVDVQQQVTVPATATGPAIPGKVTADLFVRIF